MNFFCDSKGTIFHVDPEPIYQNSTGANTIYFVGAFPSSAQVTVVYKLPNGLYTKPKLMTNVTDAVLKDIKDQYGQGFSVWKEVIGQSVTYDGNNVTYGQDFTVTENSGRVEVQFIVTASGNTNAIQLGTANSSFEVGKGVPIVPQNSVENDILAQILASLQAIEQDFSENTDDVSMLKTSVDKNSQDIAGLQETVNSHTEQISDLETNVKANTADIVKNANAIALLADVQYQSGLQVIQPISEAYTARKTANGLDILDWEGNGSPARLLTVEGDTQKTKNLFKRDISDGDVYAEYEPDGVILLKYITNGRPGFSIRTNKLPAGKYTLSIEYSTGTVGDLLFYKGSEEQPYFAISTYPYSRVITLEEEMSVRIYGEMSGMYPEAVIIKLQIEAGETQTEYAQYFDGFKSTSFQGIVSKNTDGTKVSVLSLPSAIDCGFGTTIDFENQKIIETYGEYTFNGSERVDTVGVYGSNGYYYYILRGAFAMALGSGQVGLCDRYPTDKRGWLYADRESVRFGQNNKALYLFLSKDLTADEVKALINGMKIRYPLATPIENPFSEGQKAVGNEYTAWKNGTEEVQGNANSSYGIYPTLTQEYVTVIDIQDTIQDSIEESVDSSIRQALQGEY